jgi:hypothetical protein
MLADREPHDACCRANAAHSWEAMHTSHVDVTSVSAIAVSRTEPPDHFSSPPTRRSNNPASGCGQPSVGPAGAYLLSDGVVSSRRNISQPHLAVGWQFKKLFYRDTA